jgi:hypothetical protein
MQSGKVRQCPVEQCAGPKLRQTLRRQKIKWNGHIGDLRLHAIPTRMDHSFRGIAGDNRDVQHGKKERVFPSSAIEHQDFVAGSKGVRKDFPHGSALGADP